MTLVIKELAIAKNEGIIKNERYNAAFNVLQFEIEGKDMQVHISSNEYEAYQVLVEIYKHRKCKSIF